MATDSLDRFETLRSRSVPVVVIVLTVGIFGVAISLISEHLRSTIREQIVRRDSEVLNAAALVQQYAEDSQDDAGLLAEHPMDQLSVVLKTSRLKGVRGVRLFDANGRFITADPPNVSEALLNQDDLSQLRKTLQPISHYHPAGRLADYFWLTPDARSENERSIPLLEAIVPIRSRDQTRLLGVAQFILDGQHIRAELAQTVDRYLFRHATLVFLFGGFVIAAALSWAFHRLQRTNRLLAERTASLLRANHELTLAAKTSAVGAVSAHLIHGLKNPLFGLQNFVSNRSQGKSTGTDTEWRNAVATTQRMQSLINDVVRVLREESHIGDYEITAAELAEIITGKMQPLAREAGVRFHTDLRCAGTLANRDANLVMLILENLIQNAIQATARGKAVQFSLSMLEQRLVCEVRDEGPGLSDTARKSLFSPCQSIKAGGSGIGLAISKQLASHLGADLELKSSQPDGCAFVLSLPIKLVKEATTLAPDIISRQASIH